jgi:hypothetical protein
MAFFSPVKNFASFSREICLMLYLLSARDTCGLSVEINNKVFSIYAAL